MCGVRISIANSIIVSVIHQETICPEMLIYMRGITIQKYVSVIIVPVMSSLWQHKLGKPIYFIIWDICWVLMANCTARVYIKFSKNNVVDDWMKKLTTP
mmetsp:Transcript_5527/g.9075  ORF Transcript_5527/g.9075 Transcript_5527/m.9075 type:complete len:99 (-) Transcript_5527:113-409(-)